MEELKRMLGELEKRVADLEAQSQQQKPTPLSLMRAAVEEALQSLSHQS